MNNLILKIRRKENRFYEFLGSVYKNFSFPCITPLHKTFWWERKIRLELWRWFLKVFYYTPLFKSICFRVGGNLNLIDGLPFVNENIKIIVGDDVTIHGDAGFQGYKVNKNPVLEIDDSTFIGPQVRIGVGKEIKIGKYCLIAARVYISDHDGHPLGWQDRRERLPVTGEEIKPIMIEDDVWIGEGAFICKGVKIGRGAVIAARSVITKDVEPFTIVGGNPAIIIKKIQ
ncbi:MAG: acyltransferase [Candidatus Omnitrophota bacterium]